MKKVCVKFPVMLSLILSCFLLNSKKVVSQASKSGDIIIQPYFGFPNLQKSGVKFISELAGVNYKVNSIGHIGLSGEYLISDKWGIGLNAIYSPMSYSSNSESFYIFDPYTDEESEEIQEKKVISNRFRLLLMFHPHIDIDNPKWDLLFSVGLGVLGYKTKYLIDNQEVSYSKFVENYVFKDSNESSAGIPISIRVAFGARHYFNDWLGISLEAGLGGPLISVGLSFKFPNKKTYTGSMNE